MSFLIWNCRGAGCRSFPGLIRDCIRIYHLDFVAILEPCISGVKADSVIRKIGMDGAVRVEASVFSGGIWCLWKQTRVAISVLSTSRYCVHLKVNPNSAVPWYLSVIYASPHPASRVYLWEELRNISVTVDSPWAMAGDFNIVLYEFEKDDGAPASQSSYLAFAGCLDECNLMTLVSRVLPTLG